MALIHCPECQKEVSSVALACPQCAYPYPGRAESGNGHSDKALRTCPDCKRLISRQIQLCPHCGAPAHETEGKREITAPEEDEEILLCPHCGVGFTRPQKPRKPVEGFDSLLLQEEKTLNPDSELDERFDETEANEELAGDPLPSVRKKKPLWGETKESSRERPRHSKPKKGWNMYLFIALVVLLLFAGWAFWELRGVSGLEALVYWNRS